MTHLILYGLPASGKTTFGKKLAASLQRDFIDTDLLIEAAYAERTLSCREIYRKEGSSFFRALETQVILHLNPPCPSVIACGGGALQAKENVAHLKCLGTLLYLRVPLAILWERITQKGLPAYLDDQPTQEYFERIAQERTPLYQKIADIIIDMAI